MEKQIKKFNIKSFLILLKNCKHSRIKKNTKYTNLSETVYLMYPKINVELVFISRFGTMERSHSHKFESGESIKLVVGDEHDAIDQSNAENSAHATMIDFNVDENIHTISTSITGLPPVFVYYGEDFTVFSSDIYMLLMVDGVRLELENTSVIDLARVGHLTKRKSLFKNCSMVEGGHKIILKKYNNFVVKKTWTVKDEEKENDLQKFCETQIEIFKKIIKDSDFSSSFLSLTSGLDTRAIFSALVNEKKNLTHSFTMTGEMETLDARIARLLSENYGIKHRNVVLGDKFLAGLENYIYQASRLSGGVCSLSQAQEVYFYEMVKGEFSSRISGNMGNQVGRGGTEGVSMRNSNLKIFKPEFLESVTGYDFSAHWFDEMQSVTETSILLSLLQDEIPNSLVGNYCIGNYYAIQKSPYAHRQLIELVFKKPQLYKIKDSFSVGKVRLRDLKHRFLGESEKSSFQRQLIKRYGGFAAKCPINWGWRASGGVSIPGLMMGGGSLVDALAESKLKPTSKVKNFLKKTGISGLHVYVHQDAWTRKYLRNFVYDTILSCRAIEIFDKNFITHLLDEYFVRDDAKHFSTLGFLLDFSVAEKNFCS